MKKPVYGTKATKDPHAKGVANEEFVRGLLNRFGITIWNHKDGAEQLRYGENRQGVEIKLDSRCTDTGRLSIEVAEKTHPDNVAWIPSGIFTEDNAWGYVQGNSKIVFVFSKKLLRRYFHHNMPDLHEKYGTIRTFYLNFDTAHRLAIFVIDGGTGERWSGDGDIGLSRPEDSLEH